MVSAGVGYLCCGVAAVCFGSNYLPVKQIDVKDGNFFTMCLAVGILIIGIIQWLYEDDYKLEPFAMVGGATWALGNVFTPFIIKNCGLGVGSLVWGATNMLTGWATGNFGLFGHNQDTVGKPALNYLGVALAVFTLGLFSQLKEPDDACDVSCEANIGSARAPFRADMEMPSVVGSSEANGGIANGGTNARNSGQFTLGFIAALVAGVLYGSNFDAPTWLQQKGEEDKAHGLPPDQWRHSPDASHYVISHFAGIFVTTALYFGIRCLTSTPKIYVGREIVLPGIASGLGWAIAQCAWFTANDALSFVIAFPIITSLPGIIAALWGTLLFNENRGMRNKVILGAAILVQVTGVTLIALSKS